MVNLLNNVYVVNLERSKDRLENIDKNLKKYGISYKRFNAVDGKKMSDDEISQMTTSACRYLLCNKSIIGCAMSHISLWNIISQSSDKWHLVLEDDIEFTNKTIDFINALSRSSIMNEDNIIISLACIGPFCGGPKVNIPKTSSSEYNPESYLVELSLVESRFPLGTAAYFITKNTAKKLYDHFIKYKINYHIDNQIASNLSTLGIKYLATTDEVITVDQSNSTIGSKSMYILSTILNKFGMSNIAWLLSVPILTINMTVAIDGYIFIFILLLAINLIFLNSILLYIYLLIELVIWIILKFI